VLIKFVGYDMKHEKLLRTVKFHDNCAKYLSLILLDVFEKKGCKYPSVLLLGIDT
jgi:hypothetical protein